MVAFFVVLKWLKLAFLIETFLQLTLTIHVHEYITFLPFDWLVCSGTTQGDILILNSTGLRVQTMVRKAHLGFVTALAFSHDSRF